MRRQVLGRAYYRLWSAHTLSNLGGGMYYAALPLLASSVTDQPALVAGVAVAIELPWLSFGLLAGAIADRVQSIQRLAIVATAGTASLVALLAVTVAYDLASLFTIYVIAFVCGSLDTLSGTATTTMTPRLVEPQQLDRANGRLIVAGSTGNELLGPAIGGYLFGLAAVLPFAVNASTAAVAAALLCTLPRLLGNTTRSTAGQPASGRSVWRDIADGMRWLLVHRRLRSITVLSMVFALTDTAWFALIVLYVKDILGLPASAYGVLLGIGAVGGLAGGLLAARLSRAVSSIRVLLPALLLAAAIAQAVLAFTAHTVLTAGSLATSSFAFGVWNVVTVTQFQTLTPSELLGRVSSANRTAIMGASPIGALLGGLAANAMGIRAPFVLGLPVLLVGVLFGWFALRQTDLTSGPGVDPLADQVKQE